MCGGVCVTLINFFWYQANFSFRDLPNVCTIQRSRVSLRGVLRVMLRRTSVTSFSREEGVLLLTLLLKLVGDAHEAIARSSEDASDVSTDVFSFAEPLSETLSLSERQGAVPPSSTSSRRSLLRSHNPSTSTSKPR